MIKYKKQLKLICVSVVLRWHCSILVGTSLPPYLLKWYLNYLAINQRLQTQAALVPRLINKSKVNARSGRFTQIHEINKL